jgi:hypothetical protein
VNSSAIEKKAHLLVIIDTEEEFDWSKGFFREKTSISHMRSIGKIQSIFENYNIVPVYVINYPIASQSDGFAPLKEFLKNGCCHIGAHMHPWVNPPYEEEVCNRNSFPGNLPPALEYAKLGKLCQCIEQNLGLRPKIYKAGRYGLGSSTTGILEKQDFEFDVSVCPHTDFSGEGGPDFTHNDAGPYWFGLQKQILELPLTVGFEGIVHRWGSSIYSKLNRELFRKSHILGILRRMRLLNRVVLSPEGSSLDEMVRLVRTLYKDGMLVFSLAFHSPSVEPGNTPYVSSEKDLRDFLSKLQQFFDFFFGEIGHPSTPFEARKALKESFSPYFSETL